MSSKFVSRQMVFKMWSNKSYNSYNYWSQSHDHPDINMAVPDSRYVGSRPDFGPLGSSMYVPTAHLIHPVSCGHFLGRSDPKVRIWENFPIDGYIVHLL